jgi:Domain of unknown function (DUF362)
MGKKKSTSRRNFLKMTAIGAAGITLASRVDSIFARRSDAFSPGPGNKWPGRVAINFNKAAVTASGADTTVIKKMVDDVICMLTDQTTVGEAWKAAFPSTLTASSKIAVKVNTLNPGIPAPHWSSVKAITDGLQLMDFNGTKYPQGNITIYDMNNGLPAAGNLATAGYKAANFPGISIVTDTPVDGGDGALNNKTYAASLKNADFLINVFSPRGHTTPPKGSQFTLGFKSHFGTYSDPSTTLHPNISQNLADINCAGVVYNKTVLSMCSGIYGMNEGNGPAGSADNYTTYAQSIDKTSVTQCPTTIIMSTDPVSAEMQAIKMMRINKNGAYTVADMPPYLQASAGLSASGFSSVYTIGIIDESQMNMRKMINGVAAVMPYAVSGALYASGVGIAARHVEGHDSAFIEFNCPVEHAGREAFIEIYTTKGAVVRKLPLRVLGVRNNVSWDERDGRGSLVSTGTYIVELISNGKHASAPLTIVR